MDDRLTNWANQTKSYSSAQREAINVHISCCHKQEPLIHEYMYTSFCKWYRQRAWFHRKKTVPTWNCSGQGLWFISGHDFWKEKFLLNFSHIFWGQTSPRSISLKQSSWINSTTGKRKKLHFCFYGGLSLNWVKLKSLNWSQIILDPYNQKTQLTCVC